MIWHGRQRRLGRPSNSLGIGSRLYSSAGGSRARLSLRLQFWRRGCHNLWPPAWVTLEWHHGRLPAFLNASANDACSGRHFCSGRPLNLPHQDFLKISQNAPFNWLEVKITKDQNTPKPMKPGAVTFSRNPFKVRGFEMRSAALAAVALSVFTAVQLGAAVIDDFEDGVKFGPGGGAGYTNYFLWGVANGELVIRKANPTPIPPYPGTMETYDNIYWPTPRLPDNNLEEGRTLELRMDLIHASADDLFLMPMCGGNYEGAETIYWAFVDRNEVALVKYRNDTNNLSRSHITTFYWDIIATTFENVTVKLLFTKTNSSSLAITVKIVDKGNQQATLYERTFVDGPGQDGPVPSPDPHGYGFFTPDQGVPYPALSFAAAGCSHAIRTVPPPLEMRVDNVGCDVYYPPHLEIAQTNNGVALSWMLPQEEHIVVQATNLAGPWSPCQQPHTRTGDAFCLQAPCDSCQKFFRLTPGRQFTDDFSALNPSWAPIFQEAGEEWTVTNGVLQLDWAEPPSPGFALAPLGTNAAAEIKDFCASMDILDWVTTTTNYSTVALAARCRGLSAYFAGLNANAQGIRDNARLWIYNGSTYTNSPSFDIKQFPPPYRLRFTGVGTQLLAQVFSLTMGEVLRELTINDSAFSEGFVVLWINGKPVAGNFFTVTMDNFFMAGTK